MLVDDGREAILNMLVGNSAIETFDMGLYTSSSALVETDTYASIVEVGGGVGYARQALAGWGAPINIGGGVWDVIAGNVTFSNTSGSPITVYGFFFIGHTTSIFYGGDLIAGGPLTLPAGGSLIFSPSWNDTTN